jgi:hypothetical protein
MNAGRIKTYHPRLSVKLWKVSKYRGGRSERYAEMPNPIELADYIGDKGYVTVNKDIQAEAGAFVIVFSDKPEKKAEDSVYGLIAPMDYIEIRMAHKHVPAGEKLPIVMRGFVNKVGIRQRMGSNGKPLRGVVVHGQDYSKILGQIRVFYGKAFEIGTNLIREMLFSSSTGTHRQPYSPPGGFYKDVLDKVVQPWLRKMWQQNTLSSAEHRPWQLKTDVDSVTEGAIFPSKFESFQGSMWQLFRAESDKYWNEIFIEDRKDGTYLVYRPIPYRDLKGNQINNSRDPGTVKIALSDVVFQNLDRSDAKVGNYFYVIPRPFMLTGETSARAAGLSDKQDYILRHADNANPDLYGWRPFIVDSQQGFTGMTKPPTNLPKTEQEKSNGSYNIWATRRRNELVALNRDNVLWEFGTMELFGDPGIRGGMYLDLDYGAFRAQYYMESATHKYVPYEGYTTAVRVVRGTGWINRMAASGSPYFGEREVGAYGR